MNLATHGGLDRQTVMIQELELELIRARLPAGRDQSSSLDSSACQSYLDGLSSKSGRGRKPLLRKERSAIAAPPHGRWDRYQITTSSEMRGISTCNWYSMTGSSTLLFSGPN